MVASARVCRTIPGDLSWPSASAWAALNRTVGGRLVRTLPIASACYDLGANSSDCQTVQARWHMPELHEQDSSSIMSASASNRSCDPFIFDRGCHIKDYVEYSVNVSTISDIVSAVKYAKQRNIRFVVKNTGHDYMGKSTGHGALAVWTHHLQNTTWIHRYSSKAYTGPAVKMQSGVLVKNMYRQAFERGLSLVGGLCPTVGMAGGYIQGGGHSPLAGHFGLAADNTLEFEVITTSGQFLIASPSQNTDLFWALSGGGGGTYAIVWSVTIKAHPNLSISGAALNFTSANVTEERWWKAVDAYRAWTRKSTPLGGYSIAFYTTSDFILPIALTANKTEAEFSSLFQPFLDDLAQLGIAYKLQRFAYQGLYEVYDGLFPEDERFFDGSVQNVFMGGRLLPIQSYDDPTNMKAISNTIRRLVEDGATGYEISVTPRTVEARSATLPQWRTTQTLLVIVSPRSDTATAAELERQQDKMTNDWMPQVYRVTPGAGAYLNEADPFNKNFKEDYYGVNYDRLLKIKQKYDPDFLLYGETSVGGDLWQKQSDGRLCSA